MIDEFLMQEILAGEFSPEESSAQVGDMVVHNKRGSSYEIKCMAEAEFDGNMVDNEKIEILTVGNQDFLDVTVQVSTENHSKKWFVYQNFHGQVFIRPCSEFTSRRFSIL